MIVACCGSEIVKSLTHQISRQGKQVHAQRGTAHNQQQERSPHNTVTYTKRESTQYTKTQRKTHRQHTNTNTTIHTSTAADCGSTVNANASTLFGRSATGEQDNRQTQVDEQQIICYNKYRK